jgi:hypothetical protein
VPQRKVLNVRFLTSTRASSQKVVLSLQLVALTAVLVQPRPSSAEVIISKTDTWEVFTAGRVNAFLSYGFGDAYPVGEPVPGLPDKRYTVVPGGGVETNTDVIPRLDGMGNPTPAQGTVSKFRVRSGFLPNVLTLGLRRKLNDTTTMTVQLSIWGTIEPDGQRKYVPIEADFREGFLQIDAPWGTVQAGRMLNLFSRGATQLLFDYAHGYGLGFPGTLHRVGPTAGLIGFGVLAASHSPGVTYATPNWQGLQLSTGVFDPVNLAGSWESTRTPRPEAEATYTRTGDAFKVQLFANTAFQKLYKPARTDSETVYGAGYGGRFEFGRFRLGGSGHWGKGLGLSYALEGSPTSSTTEGYKLRFFDGYSGFGQVALGRFDLFVAYGASRVHLLDWDKTNTLNESVMKNQTGIAGGVVCHIANSVHIDLDYMRAQFLWYRGEAQNLNFINTGVTATW